MKKIVLLTLLLGACTTTSTGGKVIDPNFIHNAQVAAMNACALIPTAEQIISLFDKSGAFVSTLQIGAAACALFAPVLG